MLNLVTEEERPLRVTMKNGKEFLMFPRDLFAPLHDHDFRLILIAAMRYAMGRNTYMPMVVADYIKRHIQRLDDKFLVLGADDIRRHFEDQISGRAFWMRLKQSGETESPASKEDQALPIMWKTVGNYERVRQPTFSRWL